MRNDVKKCCGGIDETRRELVYYNGAFINFYNKSPTLRIYSRECAVCHRYNHWGDAAATIVGYIIGLLRGRNYENCDGRWTPFDDLKKLGWREIGCQAGDLAGVFQVTSNLRSSNYIARTGK